MSVDARPVLSHVGIFVFDIRLMTRFYESVFGLRLTDRGHGRRFKMLLHFLSNSPEQHHQVVLAEGRAPEAPSSINQLSFKVRTIDELRQVSTRATREGATKLETMNHGNALSIYFSDPEANTVEVYLDTPWYVPQPHADPLDLDKPNEEIWAETEKNCRADPGFMTVAAWSSTLFPPSEASNIVG